jgi:hypothetical protein
MLERLIYTVLQDSIATYVRDRDLIERLFIQRGLDAAEAQKIRDLFQRLPPDVIHNYPREDSRFPLFAIVLGDEAETTKFLDDSGGLLTEEEAVALNEAGLAGSIVRTSIYTPEFHIYTVTDAPDTTIYYYHILKNILSIRRGFFKAHGVLDTRFGGTDLVPELRYLPAYLFFRRLTMTCQIEEASIEERSERVRAVQGIHVNDGSTIDELGGVVARVDVIGSEEG